MKFKPFWMVLGFFALAIVAGLVLRPIFQKARAA